jgi:thiamine biosynthesis protein ThiS
VGEEVTITLNGADRAVAAGSTIGAIVDLVVVDRSRVAVERNLEIVKRDAWDTVSVAPGDVIEVVTLVGGG